MATRHQVREVVISMLYAYDMGNTEIEKFEDEIFENKKIRNKQKEFALALMKGVITNLDNLDNEIDKHLKAWDINEIGHIERAILRLGTYELINAKVDQAVAINEAIELAKSLGNDNVPKFVNGVLDSVQKDLKNRKEDNK